MKPRYKCKKAQQQYEKLLLLTYPLSIKKDKIGGAFADAFNAGYEGKKGGIYRFKKGTVGFVFYYAGKTKREIDNKNSI